MVSLAMVLHELSTNAAKYGAFSNGRGRVQIAWRQLDDGMAELTWTEHEGPTLSGEPVPGFGNKLISRVMSYDLQGSAKMRYEPEGLACRCRAHPRPSTPTQRWRRESSCRWRPQEIIRKTFSSNMLKGYEAQ
jgi:two-component sensor histidine kinase